MRGRARSVAVVCIALLLLTTLAAYQNRARGQIRNRDGAPVSQCQVDFYLGREPQPSYRVYSDRNGFFYLDNPTAGRYQVLVSQGKRSYRFDEVSIKNDGSKSYMRPDVLVVPW